MQSSLNSCHFIYHRPKYSSNTSCPFATIRDSHSKLQAKLQICIFLMFTKLCRPPLWCSGQSSWLQIGDVLCFLWGTNWIYICCVEESRPPLCSSGQSSWLQIQGAGFDSRRYQIFWEVVALEWGPLSLMTTIKELLERKCIGSGLETENTAVGICHADHVAPSIRKH
jgi:hypothetical protein